MDTLPVTLIVKAPNQQFEDQTIKCEPTWSIRKLKGYLSEVYPCNPTLEEQKLIYSGQLLNDAHILKDVLRQYEGQDTHTVHLVYTPKNRPIASTTAKTSQYNCKNSSEERNCLSRSSQQPEPTFTADGLRQRNAVTNANTSSAPLQNPLFMNGYLNTSQPFNLSNMGQLQSQYTPEQYALAQQMAMQNMMHQMYLQYMNQYAASIQQSNPVSNMHSYFPQTNFGTTMNTGTTTSNNEQRTPPQPQEAAAAVQPPRLQAAAADDEAENRDWLEVVYTLSRLLVLLSLVYFYSSPVRCMIVILAFVLYYFYQSHQRNLRDRQQSERQQQEADAGEPDDISIENVQDPNANANDVGENEQRNENLTNSDTESTTSLASGADESYENHRLPAITLLRTFILSFFSSLIPETPAV